jgi:hypothetical protein
MYPPLVYSKISYGMIKVIDLSCTFSMIVLIKDKKMFIIDYKEH